MRRGVVPLCSNNYLILQTPRQYSAVGRSQHSPLDVEARKLKSLYEASGYPGTAHLYYRLGWCYGSLRLVPGLRHGTEYLGSVASQEATQERRKRNGNMREPFSSCVYWINAYVQFINIREQLKNQLPSRATTVSNDFGNMTLYTIFSAFALLSPPASALPNTLFALQTITTETWQIPRLDMHMMSIGTGIPGNPPWPEDSKFDSTIDFDVMVPAATGLAKWNCQGAMANSTITERLIDCVRYEEDGEGGLMFGMQKYDGLGERRAELSFSLWLYRNRYAFLAFYDILTIMHMSTYTDADYRVDKTVTCLSRRSQATQLSQQTTRRNQPVILRVFRVNRTTD